MNTDFLPEIRKEMARSYRPREAGGSIANSASGETASLEQAGITSALAALHGSYALVGQMPPEPPTWRGRAGNRAVKLVRRMLFWYTPQIVRFQYSALRAFEEQARALESANQSLRTLQRRHEETRESLESDIRKLESELLAERARNDTLHHELQTLRDSFAGAAQPNADHSDRSAQ